MPTLSSRLKTETPFPGDVNLVARYILEVQREDGLIPWYSMGKSDPWDHVECAMALTVARCPEAAKAALHWSRRNQLDDGSWWSEYREGIPAPCAHKDANMSAYIAVGVLHYFLATGDRAFLRDMWPTVKAAMAFILDLQAPGGQIRWARRADGTESSRALLTGSSSIYMSLRCALEISHLMDEPMPAWQAAAERLRYAIRRRPHLFDASKARYAMDWYYPVLTRAISGEAAQRRLKRSWQTFVMDGWGTRCVSDQPWVTVAETAELVMALIVLGDTETALGVFDWIRSNRYENGAFWTGVTVPDGRIYTREKTTWTGAAVLLATDLLYGLTPSYKVFCL